MHWEIQQGTDITGPFSEDEILMMVEAGRIDGDTLVRPEGKQAWKPATRHGRFAAALRAVAAASGTGTAAGEGAAARSRRAPIDGIPYKDPARWDQQTQLGMPVATLLPGGVPAALAEPKASGGTALNGGAAAAGTRGTGTNGGAAIGGGAGLGTSVGVDGAAGRGAGTDPGAGTGGSSGPPPLPGALAFTGGASGTATGLAPAPASGAGSAVGGAAPFATAREARPVVAVAGGAPARRPEGGVLSGLFDLGFTRFVTARLARLLYAVYVVGVLATFVVSCVVGVGTVQTAQRIDSQTMLLAGAAQLLATPIVCLIALVIGRVVAESVVVFFRVAEHLAEIDRKTAG